MPVRVPDRRRRSGVLTAVVFVAFGVAGLTGALGHVADPPSSGSMAPQSEPMPPSAPTAPSASSSGAPSPAAPEPIPGGRPDQPPGGELRSLGASHGVVLHDVTVFDDDVPAVSNLDRDLARALRAAARDAADAGVGFDLTSGWRSPAYQAQLLREAVIEHGSEAEAARWVATADTSAHVSGDAVDLGPDAAAWLSRHGARFGLCQVYDNEPWHYELRPRAVERGCPARYADPTHDPRMRR